MTRGQSGGGVILYFRNSILMVQVLIGNNADHNESLWCIVVSLNLRITIGLIYHKPDLMKAENYKIL